MNVYLGLKQDMVKMNVFLQIYFSKIRNEQIQDERQLPTTTHILHAKTHEHDKIMLSLNMNINTKL